jgi:tRNA pseudouridine55 synthase
MAGFTGAIRQTPPMYSAIRHEGHRLHELARAGVVVEREAREVVVHRFDLVACAPPRARFAVECSKGTYVRSLVHDLGQTLGVGAHLVALRRTRSGPFGLGAAVSLSALEERPDAIPLVGLESATAHLPSARVEGSLAAAVVHGKSLLWKDLSEVPPPAGPARLLGPAGALLAIVSVQGGRVQYGRVWASGLTRDVESFTLSGQ